MNSVIVIIFLMAFMATVAIDTHQKIRRQGKNR